MKKDFMAKDVFMLWKDGLRCKEKREASELVEASREI